jgi:predicted nucleic acid-binding protein
MIVVDSSVWIDYLNGAATAQTVRLDDLLGRETILVGDIILCEVLQGLRTEVEAGRVENALREFHLVPMLDASLAVRAAANYRALRRIGITLNGIADLIIGTYCIERGHTLLHSDRDYDAMARHLGLRVL